MLPSGISSIAYRVERVEESDAGVARSSLPGTKRMVKAWPAIRGVFGSSRIRSPDPNVPQSFFQENHGQSRG